MTAGLSSRASTPAAGAALLPFYPAHAGGCLPSPPRRSRTSLRALGLAFALALPMLPLGNVALALALALRGRRAPLVRRVLRRAGAALAARARRRSSRPARRARPHRRSSSSGEARAAARAALRSRGRRSRRCRRPSHRVRHRADRALGIPGGAPSTSADALRRPRRAVAAPPSARRGGLVCRASGRGRCARCRRATTSPARRAVVRRRTAR